MSPERHTRFDLLLCFTLLLLVATHPWAAAPVVIVTGERGGAYDELADAIDAELRSEFPDIGITVVDWDVFAGTDMANARVVVTIGSRAAAAVRAAPPPVPVLNTLLPRQAFASLANNSARPNDSAIFVDQPLKRQLAVIALALPDWQRIALIGGPQTTELVAGLAAAAEVAGFEVVVARVGSERDLYPAIQDTISRPAILLAVPDGEIFNSHTIHNILLTSYRLRSPVVGFSPAYVRAGALLALYSTPEQIGRQAAAGVASVLRGGRLPPPRHPRQFDVGINQTVARSLGIRLEPAATIRSALGRLESDE